MPIYPILALIQSYFCTQTGAIKYAFVFILLIISSKLAYQA